VDTTDNYELSDTSSGLVGTTFSDTSYGPQESLWRLAEAARTYASSSRAKNTWRAYQADWRGFTTWCHELSLNPLPATPETVTLYVVYLAHQGRKVSTIMRSLATISERHRTGGQASPTSNPVVRETLRGIRRRLGTRQAQKLPLLSEQLRALVAALPDDLSGARDRAILLVGFAMAARRSELVAVDVTDVEFTTEGAVVEIRRSKTDQDGAGRRLGIPHGSSPETCPVRALRDWISTAGITSGPVFRPIDRWGRISSERLTDRAVARIIQRYVSKVGLDPRAYGGHSLRSGLATSAARAGRSERSIMAATGHRSPEMVRRYIRQGSLFQDNAAAGLL